MHSRDTRLRLEGVDEPACAAVVLRALAAALELALDALRQRLAKLDTPLVERVDVPDRAFRECDVLIVGDERTESARSDLFGQDAGGWAVAKEDLVRDELFAGTLSLDGVWCLADHERLGLCEVVGCKHDLVLVVLDRVV